jgi:hypothetical protein
MYACRTIPQPHVQVFVSAFGFFFTMTAPSRRSRRS